MFSAPCHVSYGPLTQVACIECQAFGTLTDRRLYLDAILVPLDIFPDIARREIQFWQWFSLTKISRSCLQFKRRHTKALKIIWI